MFVLTHFRYNAKIAAQDFGVDVIKALTDSINAEFSNHIIIDVGLCITLYDFVSIGDSHLLPGEADSFTPVEFRYIVFQPFRGEVIQGTIAEMSHEGLRVSLSFFTDILIPPDKLPKISRFDENEQIWCWEYMPEDDAEAEPATSNEPKQPIKFYFEKDAQINFRVVDYTFKAIEPGAAKDATIFKVIGSASEPGFGCPKWWDEAVGLKEEPITE